MRAIVVCLVLLWAHAAASQATGLVAVKVFSSNAASSCSGVDAAVAVAYAPLDLCLVQFNSSQGEFPGLRVDPQPRIDYFAQAQCNNTALQWANGSALACAPVGPRLRANVTTVSVNPAQAYNVSYFADAACAGALVSYAPGDGVLVSGVFGQCTTSMSLQVFAGKSLDASGYSLVERVNSSHVRFTAFARNSTGFSDCASMDAVSGRWDLPIGTCVPAVWGAANSSTPFMRIEMDPPQPKPIRMYVGQIDLNADDSALNAQIVGASVGVLCGFTTFIIVFSITGLLG